MTEPTWDFYLCRLETDEPASIAIDLALKAASPDVQRPILCCIRVPYQATNPDGPVPLAAETDELVAIEDALEARMAEHLGAHYVGRISTADSREFFYYTGQLEGFADVVNDVQADYAGHTILYRSQDDADWALYREFLYPRPQEQRWMLDRRSVEELTERHDELSTPRRIEHWAFFGSAESRSSFAADISRAGYTIVATENETEHDALPYGLQFEKVSTVELPVVYQNSLQLTALAEEHGGEYDGWGCPVIEDESEGA